MTPVPIELPLRANEAAALAELVFQHAEGRSLTEDARHRLGGRLEGLSLQSMTVFPGSLVADPIHASVYYVAVDGLALGKPEPLLLRIAYASTPASGLFPKSVLIGRMRPSGGREVVVNAIPFSPRDGAHLRTYAEKIDRGFQPRPQGAQAGITVGLERCEEAFTEFRGLLKSRLQSMAGFRAGASWAGAGDAVLWAAIRAGYREGYTLAADLTGLAPEPAFRAAEEAAAFTRFIAGLTPAFQAELTDEDREWIREESPDDGFRALASEWGARLKAAENLFDHLRRVKSGAGSRSFDFELSLEGEEAETTPELAQFCLRWFRMRGRPVHLLAPKVTSAERVSGLADAVRQYHAVLSLRADGFPADQWEEIGRAASGRVVWNGIEEPSRVAVLAESFRSS